MSHDLPAYQNDAYWCDPFTLGHFIYVLEVYEELRATNATFTDAVLAGSAEALFRIENYSDLMRVSAVLANAPGKGRIQLLCEEVDSASGLTTANVIKLRARVCRAKPCTLEEANTLTLDEVADVLDVGAAKVETPPSQPTHSADFTSVDWFGVKYEFAKGLQAECVRVLWKAWENRTPSLSEKTIGEEAGSSSDRFRLDHVFKPANKKTRKREAHPAWGTMIVRAGKGVFRLAARDSESPK